MVAFIIIFINNKSLDSQRQKSNNKNNSENIAIRYSFQNCNIIFHTSGSSQSKAIQLATKSKYSHCGIIYKEGNEYLVFEAIQPVKLTPLDKWIARGENKNYAVKDLKNRSKY